MKYGIYNDSGEILRVLDVPISDIVLNIDIGEYYIPIDTLGSYYVDTSTSPHTLTPIPEKPDEYHIFDYTTKSWILSNDLIEKKRLNILNNIKSKMLSLKFSPISYDNKLLDADETAILNINGKIQEITSSEALNLPVNNLFWKDHNNIIHTWANLNNYKSWLQGLIIAISHRGTLLYGISWTKQEEVNNINTIEGLNNYNIDSGWE